MMEKGGLMKKILFLALMALQMTGCIRYVDVTGRQRVGVMLQVGIILTVVNNCSTLIDIERGGTVKSGLPYSQSAVLALESTPFTGSSRNISVTVKAYGLNNEYLGSQTQVFSVDTGSGTYEKTWEIDYVRLPNGRGGCFK